MKTLENLKKYQLIEKYIDIKGGAPVSGGWSINGSKFTYSGDLSLTHDGGVNLGVISGDSYVKDFCGSASYDGVEKTDCLQYIRNNWISV